MLNDKDSFLLLTEAVEDCAIFLLDAGGHVVSWNVGAERIKGYRAQEIIGKYFSVFYPPEAVQRGVPEQELNVAAKDERFEGEGWRVRKDGMQFRAKVIIKALRDKDGTVRGFSKVTHDLSERKRADEEAMRMVTVVRDSNDAITIQDFAGKIIAWNHGAEMMFGYSEQEALKMEIWQLAPEDKAAEQKDFMRRLLAGETITSFETQRLTKDGRILDVWLTVTKLMDDAGRPIGIASTERDITERKNAERQIREQNEILFNLHEGLMIVDLANKITLWNRAAERIIGRTQGEALGRDPIEVLGIDDRDAISTIRTAVAQVGFWNGELKAKTRDGRKITLEGHITFVRDDSDRPRARLNLFFDITEQKLIEEKFIRVQRLESIGMLAGGIAHDLNNILAPMLMAAGLLKDKLTEPRELAILTMIEQGAQRGAAIIRQLLTFSRGVESAKGNVQLRHLISEMLNIIRETFPRDIDLDSKVPVDLWVVKADPNQLNQVLMNLCVNARDAMPNGGRLSLTAANTRLTEEQANLNPLAKPGRYVVVTVADTGSGIPKEIIDRIFEPFFTTKDAGKGTGLGLSTVMGIVKNHGGFVTVYSEPARGSQFKVYLPVADEPHAEPEKTSVSAPSGHGELVLLVDDEASIRETTRQMLEAHGYRVITAANGAAALQIFVQYRDAVQLVLTDMMMPTMDGAHLIRSLRILEPSVKVVAMSGLDKAFLPEELDALGIQEVVAKPCDDIQLLQAIQHSLTIT